MLVTNVGGLSEIIQDKKSGYVTKVDSNSIADALIDFFENNRETNFKQVIIQDKQKYSWDKLIEKIKELYDQL
jgi:glycosyltransferase involved in cell wall biosynthesis